MVADGNITEGKSSLFFEYLRILKEANPKYFLLENVMMNKHSKDTISACLNTQPIQLDSNLVSIQNRKRLYWTNIADSIELIDKQLFLKDFYDKKFDPELILKGKRIK